MKSVSERLKDKFGGSWDFDQRTAQWSCSDGRVVVRAILAIDEGGERVQRFWMYEPSGVNYEVIV